MPRKKNSEVLKAVIDEAVAAPNETARRAVISRAAKRKFVLPGGKRDTRKPSPYTERMGIEICQRIALGEVLPEITKELHVSTNTVYHWIQNNTNGFADRYKTARLQMVESLVDQLLLETRHIEKDAAMAAKVRASIVQWYAGKIHPNQYGDTRRLELAATIDHKVSHDLLVDQKQRIAESWLLSQQQASVLEGQVVHEVEVNGLEKAALAVNAGAERLMPKKRKAAVLKKSADDDF